MELVFIKEETSCNLHISVADNCLFGNGILYHGVNAFMEVHNAFQRWEIAIFPAKQFSFFGKMWHAKSPADCVLADYKVSLLNTISLVSILYLMRGRERMAVGFTTTCTCAISVYHH